jgi:hypothetical protein
LITFQVIGVEAMAKFGKLLKIATVAAAVAGSLALADPAFARGGGGGGGGHGGGFGGGGFHGGGWGGGGYRGGGWGGGGYRGGGWGGRGWAGRGYYGGGGWGGPGWGWGGDWGWGVPIVVGGAYYYPYYDQGYYDQGYNGDNYPVARRVYVRPVPRSCIWRRVHVHTPSGLRWRRVRYCAQ